MATIRNPVEWGLDQLRHVGAGMSNAGHAVHHVEERLHSPAPAVARITVSDLRDALEKGLGDFDARPASTMKTPSPPTEITTLLPAPTSA